MAESLWWGKDFYNQQINFIENNEKIQYMQKKYWDIIKDYLEKNKDNWWEKDIVEVSKALWDNKELTYYVLYLLSNQELIIDDQIQLAKLKNELDRNISAPNFEIFWWEAEVKVLKIHNWKIKWLKNEKIQISQTDIKEMPELWWYELNYKVWSRNKTLLINYEGRDKISFFNEFREFLWYWDIQTKSKVKEKWRYYRNWEYSQNRITENVLVKFNIEELNLKLNFKFYDY